MKKVGKPVKNQWLCNQIIKKTTESCEKSIEHNNLDLEFKRLRKEHFRKCLNISIDKAVMEKTKQATVIPIDVGWSDLGSWSSIWDISEKDADGNVISHTNVFSVSNYEYEENENEAKRRIKILQPQFLDAAISDMKRIMKYGKSSTFINSKLKGVYNPRLSGS